MKPRARIIASSVAAIRPEIMGLGPIPAIEKLLAEAKMTMSDIDVVEINEAFAAQIVPCKEDLGSTMTSSTRSAARSRSATLRDDRRAHHDDAAQRPRDARRHLRDRVDVRGGRDGHGDDRRAAERRDRKVNRRLCSLSASTSAALAPARTERASACPGARDRAAPPSGGAPGLNSSSGSQYRSRGAAFR